MHRWLVRILAAAVIAGGTTFAFAFPTGPPASRTGAPLVGGVPAELTCTECHTTFALNLPGATLAIQNLPATYLPNDVYTFTVRMSSTFAVPRRWGFELTAVRAADGQGVGTFDVSASPTLMQVISGTGQYASRRYVEHILDGTFDNNVGPVTWTIKWRAPSTNVGRIFFFAAGNAANSNDFPTGDHIYTARDTLDPNPLLDVANPPLASLDVLEAPRPNPFRTSVALGYTLARPGGIDLAIFDAQGRRVRTLASGERPAGSTTATWDGRVDDGGVAANGVYFARLRSSMDRPALVRRITLQR